MIVIVMGVSGCGKSTVARALAESVGWLFLDADDFHPESNIRKMASGTPLTDDDRRPWLATLRARLGAEQAAGRSVALACSALKDAYRRQLAEGLADIHVVHLVGTYDDVLTLMQRREGHFMKPGMLASQFATLEPPADAIRIPVLLPCEEQVRRIRLALRL